jgi:hypothetical protein
MNANIDFHWFPENAPADSQKFGEEAETHHVIVLMHGSWVIRFDSKFVSDNYDFVVPSTFYSWMRHNSYATEVLQKI